jgi:hypothetical protein
MYTFAFPPVALDVYGDPDVSVASLDEVDGMLGSTDNRGDWREPVSEPLSVISDGRSPTN